MALVFITNLNATIRHETLNRDILVYQTRKKEYKHNILSIAKSYVDRNNKACRSKMKMLLVKKRFQLARMTSKY